MFNYFLSINVANVYLIIITILFFFCLVVYINNIKLRFKIEELKKENLYIKSYNNVGNMVDNFKDVVSIRDISLNEVDDEDKGLVSLSKESSKAVVDVSSLSKKNKNDKGKCSFDVNNNSEMFDIYDFVKDEVSSEREEKKDGYSYLDEVSFNLSNGKELNAVELTDYEKNQEENAIISYKELLKVKDDDGLDEVVSDDTGVFIEELKAFRNSLN